MKNIIIFSQNMGLGGAERALIGLLSSIDYRLYNVDLFLCHREGELLDYVPDFVNVLDENQANCLAIPLTQLIKKRSFNMLYGRLKAKYKAKRIVKKRGLKKENQVELTYSHLYTYKYIDKINPLKEYDLAISFLTPHYICLNNCNAKKKVAWIHTDYSTIDIDVNIELKMWDGFDYIASISDDCSKAFVSKFPSLKSKIIRIDNILTKSMIIRQANEFNPHEISREKDEILLCSVGRFCQAKNFDNVPEICSFILKKGSNVKWYLIGYGKDKQLIFNKIKEYNMEKHVIILGKKKNPYPYIKACDYYIQPSRYEGKAITVREAQILKKPVIITNYPTAKSQLIDGEDGKIVPLENKACAQGIVDFIKDKKLQNNIITYLNNYDYGNDNEIKKIYKLMEE